MAGSGEGTPNWQLPSGAWRGTSGGRHRALGYDLGLSVAGGTFDAVSKPPVRLAPPSPLTGDTGALMNEVVQGTRNANMTSLMAALHFDSVRLFVSRDVLNEVECDLPAYAVDRGVDSATAITRWRRWYKPLIRVVDFPEHWGTDCHIVSVILRRHSKDVATARLALALGSYVLTEDGDLTDYGLGNQDWLPLMLAFANQAEVDFAASAAYLPTALASFLSYEATTAFARLPRWLQVAALAGSTALYYTWQRNGTLEKQLARAKTRVASFWRAVRPFLLEIAQRQSAAQVVRHAHKVTPRTSYTVSEHIA